MNGYTKFIKTFILLGFSAIVLMTGLADIANASAAYTYYPSGRVKSVTYTPAEGGITYEEFLDEDWAWGSSGRLYKRILAAADSDGAISYAYVYNSQFPILSGKIDAGAQEDLVVDFGTNGIYKFMNGSTWELITTGDPQTLAIGDVDGDGKDDIIADFGTNGIYTYRNNSTWANITTANPETLAMGDLDNDGKRDIIADFGSSGLYTYTNNSTWTMITSADPQSVTICDLDNNGKKEIVADFGQYGIYVYSNNTTWANITAVNPEALTIGDIDGDGKDDIISDFGSAGLYTYTNNSVWAKITNFSPEGLVVGDIDGNGKDDLIVDLGSYGIYAYTNNSTWTQITSFNPEGLLAGDLDGNGKADVAVDFGSYGLYTFTNGVAWQQITSANPVSMSVADVNGGGKADLVVDFGASGLFKFVDNATWSNINTVGQDNGSTQYGYSNNDFTGLVYAVTYDANGVTASKTQSYSYYDDATKYLKELILEGPGEYDLVRYHYINENWGGRGYGRVDYEYKEWLYTPDFGDPYVAYADVNYAYYASSGRIESKKWAHWEDESGNTYYHYLDEAFNNNGTPSDTSDDYGRIDKQARQFGDDDGAYGYIYTYNGSTGVVVKKEGYRSAGYSDPSNPVFTERVVTYDYDTSGRLVKKTIENGHGVKSRVYTYYAENGRMESDLYFWGAPTDWVNFKHYLNELFYGIGTSGEYGRMDIEVVGQADENGAIASRYTYFGTTATVIKEEGFSLVNYNDPSSVALNGLVSTCEYDTSRRLLKKTLTDSVTTYEYNTDGRLIKMTMANGSGVVWGVYTYYATSGRVESYFADGGGYTRLDEAFYYAGTSYEYGRYDIEVRASLDDDGAIAYKYTYGTTDIAIKKECYSSADYDDPSYVVLDGLVATYYYDENGQPILEGESPLMSELTSKQSVLSQQNEEFTGMSPDTGFVAGTLPN